MHAGCVMCPVVKPWEFAIRVDNSESNARKSQQRMTVDATSVKPTLKHAGNCINLDVESNRLGRVRVQRKSSGIVGRHSFRFESVTPDDF